jgi:hypothetical protein
MKNTDYWDIKTQFVPRRGTLLLHYRIQPVNAM